MTRKLLCFAHGRDGAWEAVCVDFDLAVQGASFREVEEALAKAIDLYVAAAAAEEPAVREALLARRAPLVARLGWSLRFLLSVLARNAHGDDESRHGFTLPCHA